MSPAPELLVVVLAGFGEFGDRNSMRYPSDGNVLNARNVPP